MRYAVSFRFPHGVKRERAAFRKQVVCNSRAVRINYRAVRFARPALKDVVRFRKVRSRESERHSYVSGYARGRAACALAAVELHGITHSVDKSDRNLDITQNIVAVYRVSIAVRSCVVLYAAYADRDS